jgi:hypothetical protein
MKNDNNEEANVIFSRFCPVMSVVATAQDTMKNDDSMKNCMKSEKMSKTAGCLSGEVGEDGNTFIGDKDGKSLRFSDTM